jgi:hypothetical protein
MNKKGKIRLLSALLTLAMLVSMLPAAFAATYDASYRATVALNDVLELGDTGLYRSSLLDDFDKGSTYYITVTLPNATYYPAIHINTRRVLNNGYTFEYKAGETSSDLLECYFDADEDSVLAGTYVYTFTGYAQDKETPTGIVTLTLTVTGSGSTGNALDGLNLETNSSGYVSLDSLASSLYNLAYADLVGTPQYIYFTKVSGGDLYYGARDYTVISSTPFNIYSSSAFVSEGLWFQLSSGYDDGYISFTITSSSSSDYVTGTITINGEEEPSITYKTDYNTPVNFKASDFEDLLAKNYVIDYVKFTSLPSSKNEGDLTVGSSDVTRNTEISGDELDDVCFTPVSTLSNTTVTLGFTLRMVKETNVKSPRTVTGTIAIQVGKGGTIRYTMETGDSIYLEENDFYDAFQTMVGDDALSYVKFSNLPSKSKGTLYVEGGKTDTAVSTSAVYYYNDSDELQISNIYFSPAADFSGQVTFSYDAYGSKPRYHMEGDVTITVIAGELADVTYSANKVPVTFSVSDFSDLSYITFNELPAASQGVLYYNYNSAKANNTKVNTTSQYKTTGKTGTLLSNVTFVPADGVTGDITIPYTGYDSKGMMYSGKIIIETFVGQDTVIEYTTTGRPVTLDETEFKNACTLKLNSTLGYVQFTLPSSDEGTLYYAYGTSQQAKVSASARYTTGIYLPYISFLPKAGYSGTVTLTYTGVDTEGESYTGTISITVNPPTKSSYFTDANESWVAPAADFLYVDGVYDGVVSGSVLGIRDQITRGEVMQMIYNAFDLKDQVSSVTSNFADVPTTHPNYVAINAGNALGIALGDQGNFRPDESITRQDAMTLLNRAFTKLGLDLTDGTASDLLTFGDYAQVKDYAVDAMARMIKSGIIQGDNGNIVPLGNLTRGQMSVILYRALTL